MVSLRVYQKKNIPSHEQEKELKELTIKMDSAFCDL